VEKEIRQPYPPSTAPTTTIRRVAKNPAFLGDWPRSRFSPSANTGQKALWQNTFTLVVGGATYAGKTKHGAFINKSIVYK
jgi:hypothetical protein